MEHVPATVSPALVISSADYNERLNKTRASDAPDVQRNDDPSKYIPREAAFLLFLLVHGKMHHTFAGHFSVREARVVREHLANLYFEIDHGLYEVAALVTKDRMDTFVSFQLEQVYRGAQMVSLSELPPAAELQ